MEGHYLCKIASPDEMERKWAYEIDRNVSDRGNWILWRETALANFREGKTIPYYGILDGEIICEATAVIDPEPARRSRGLVDEQTAYLEAFRTNEPFMGQGYFSRLFAFMDFAISAISFATWSAFASASFPSLSLLSPAPTWFAACSSSRRVLRYSSPCLASSAMMAFR